ncbi:MAG: glycosyltransferase family 2 protein [Nanoarchaeota archaeon]|nr:glycosyltransferase family 2 protein [Nanoarchaeota archaeon]
MKKVSVISPVHNEDTVIRELVDRTTNVMKRNYGNSWEYIIVDDISTDGTQIIMKSIVKNNPNIRYIRLTKRGGQTGCFKKGFDKARGKIVITIDGDLQLMPEDIPLFVDKMDRGYDIVNGIREHRQHDFGLRLASRIYNLLMLLFFNCPVLDAASNYTAFKRKYIKNLNLIKNDHRYIIPICVRRGATEIGEVVVQHRDRKGGKSKYRTFNKFYKGGPEIIAAWFRLRRGRYD